MLHIIEKCHESCWHNKIKVLLIISKSSNIYLLIVIWLFSFATKICKLATKFSYLVTKLRLNFLFNSQPCMTGQNIENNNFYVMTDYNILVQYNANSSPRK